MDVSCPKCASEYELDDARVSEEGTTVKCTSCAHVFRVKKKSLVVTLPVRSDVKTAPEGLPLVGPQSSADLPPAPPLREWKLRQANGNVYPCRDLTMLQKWIVEGKVQRDDEISLSGETWKRLGNIPELASFFQVVEDATKARALEALSKVQSLPPEPLPSPAPAPAPPKPPGKITDTWRGGSFSTPVPDPSKVGPHDKTLPPDAEEPGPAPRSVKETIQGGRFTVPPPIEEVPTPAAPARSASASQSKLPKAPPAPRPPEPSDEDLRRAVGGGGGGKWFALVLAGLAVGGGVGYYFGVYEPEHLAALERAQEQARLDEEARVKAELLKNTPPPIVVDASVELERPDAAVAEVVDAGPAVVDAGVAEVVDAGKPVVDAGTPAKPDAGTLTEPKKTYEWYLAQGERLREREKAGQALDFYGFAHDLKPDRVEPLAGKGLCLLDLGNANAATAAFEQALKLGPRYGPAIMGMAEALRTLGKNEQAIEYYQRYLDVLPNGSEAPVARNSIERLKK